MSCQPGSPCYSSTTNCSGDPCNPNNGVSCETVYYTGPTLPTLGIATCTNLCEALQIIDSTITTIINNISGLVTASNGLTKVGDDIRLGGNLTQTTVINTGVYDLILGGIDAGSSSDDILVITAGGIVKKVAASSLAPTISLTPNTGLEWTDAPTNTQLQTLYNTLIPDNITSIQVGGAVPHLAQYWKTRTLVEVFDEILFPDQLPTYTIADVGMSGVTTTTYEIGTVVPINSTVTANKWDAGAFSILRILKTVNGTSSSPIIISPINVSTGIVFGVNFPGIPDPNSPNVVYTGTYSDPSFQVPAPTGSNNFSTVTYQPNGDHAAGLPKKTSRNNTDPTAPACNTTTAPQSACTTSGPVYTITGRYPIFYGSINSGNPSGISDIATLISGGSALKLPIATDGSGVITAPFGNQTAKWFYIAVPASYGAKTTYKTVWNNIFGPFGTGATSAWNNIGTQNITSPTFLWSNISYRIYRTNYATNTTGDVQIY